MKGWTMLNWIFLPVGALNPFTFALRSPGELEEVLAGYLRAFCTWCRGGIPYQAIRDLAN